MSTSIRESILENIKTTLQEITIANGYNNTLVSVERWKQRGNNIRLVPCVVVNAGPEEKQPRPNPQVTSKLSVFLDVYMRQDDTDTTNSDTVINSLALDIEKALMIDYTRGGYAEETNIINIVPFESLEGQPIFGIIFELEIIYKHLLTDPAVYV